MFEHRASELSVALFPAILAPFLTLVVACDEAPLEPNPENELTPDTAEVRGRLVLAGDSVDDFVTLTWIPGTESVVYSASPSTGGCAIKSVDVTTGVVNVLDDDCVDVPGSRNSLWRNIVVAGDGSALYYASMVGASAEWELRSVDLSNGVVSTLRKDMVYVLALSPDARKLSYVAGPDDSLVLRDVSTGFETVLGDYVFPLLFSPDGTELLYEELQRQLYRLSLAGGTSQAVTLPDTLVRYAYHWDSNGLRVLASESGAMQVRNLLGGGLVHIGDTASFAAVQAQTTIWSVTGERVAYGIYHCLDDVVIAGSECRNERVALHVADPTTSASERVAFVRPTLGSTVFSPSGDRIVYSVNGDLYVSDVPSS
jgi:hypothetical protein